MIPVTAEAWIYGKNTYTIEQILATEMFSSGTTYSINLSSLCGSREYMRTNPNAGREIMRQRLSTAIPSGARRRLNAMARGKAE